MPFGMNRSGGGLGGVFGGGRRRGGGGMGALKIRLAIGAVIALVVLVSYFMNTSVNPVTGQKQHVGGISEGQEIQMGLASMGQMAGEFGGESQSPEARAVVDRVGRRLLDVVDDVYPNGTIPWKFSFTLLEDDQTVNAFALPGGPTFITEALFKRLETEGQLAGVLGHEIGHVIHRHGMERMAKGKLLQGLVGAATVASGDMGAGQILAVVGNTKMMKYGRADELECDAEGIKLMVKAGYDPRSMIGVMDILKEASGGASKTPEWQSSHPHPENRAEKIDEIIAAEYPNGLPSGLER
ncbi:MAG: M48 family metallopeptidase [Algisphaera sp.]